MTRQSYNCAWGASKSRGATTYAGTRAWGAAVSSQDVASMMSQASQAQALASQMQAADVASQVPNLQPANPPAEDSSDMTLILGIGAAALTIGIGYFLLKR